MFPNHQPDTSRQTSFWTVCSFSCWIVDDSWADWKIRNHPHWTAEASVQVNGIPTTLQFFFRGKLWSINGCNHGENPNISDPNNFRILLDHYRNHQPVVYICSSSLKRPLAIAAHPARLFGDPASSRLGKILCLSRCRDLGTSPSRWLQNHASGPKQVLKRRSWMLTGGKSPPFWRPSAPQTPKAHRPVGAKFGCGLWVYGIVILMEVS